MARRRTVEDHVDRLLACRRGVGLVDGAGQVWHEERPADQPQELHEGRDDADRRAGGEEDAIGTREADRNEAWIGRVA